MQIITKLLEGHLIGNFLKKTKTKESELLFIGNDAYRFSKQICIINQKEIISCTRSENFHMSLLGCEDLY